MSSLLDLVLSEREHELARTQHPLVERPGLAPPAERVRDLAPRAAPAQTATPQIGTRAQRQAVFEKACIGAPRWSDPLPEQAQDRVGCLPVVVDLAEDPGVPAPRKGTERLAVGNQPGTHGIEVDVANELEEVGFLLDDDGLEAVLKEMAVSPMAAVELAGVTAEDALQDPGNTAVPRSRQEMDVVGDQRPGEDIEIGTTATGRQALHEVGAIVIIAKDATTLDSTSNHMMEDTGGVEPGGTRHFDIEPQRVSYDNFITLIFPTRNLPNLLYVPEFPFPEFPGFRRGENVQASVHAKAAVDRQVPVPQLRAMGRGDGCTG